jgi:2,3-bisphosphoglycerate-dependent phosphoglycerate mutase
MLLRHGQSTWNAENRFTGWVDVDLSATGEEEARRAGELIGSAEGLTLDVCHTSVLTRAIRTADIALYAAGLSWLPVSRHWRLNERHYGALQGLNKSEMTQKHGADQVKVWRRSFDVPPPPLTYAGAEEADGPGDRRYHLVPPGEFPVSEALADVVWRLRPYYEDVLVPELLEGHNVIVVAHGNSLRALIYRLEGLSDDEVVSLEIPTGFPRVYELDDSLAILSATYLGDLAAIEAAAHAVAHQADVRNA